MKKIILLMLLLSIVAFAIADVTVSWGTNAQYPPMSTYYKYYRSAALYLSSEIDATGTITHLQWYCARANTSTSFPVTIWMKTTSATSLAADTWDNINTGTTQVFSGTLLANTTGWYNFDITDFNYTSGNLLILVQSGEATFSSPYVQWNCQRTSDFTTDNLFTRAYSDGGLPTSLTTDIWRPSVKLVGITQTTPPGVCNLVFPTPTGVEGVSNRPTLQWSATTGDPTGYDVYFGETLPAEGSPNVGHDTQTTTSWAPGVLNWNTTYSWKIVPHNAYGSPLFDDCPTWTFKTQVDPTIYLNPSIDYSEYFDTVTVPALPYGWTVTEGAAGASQHWKTATTDSHGPTDPVSAPNFAYLYCYLANTTYNPYCLVTPPVSMDAIPRRLVYSYWIGSSTYENPLFVDVSTDQINWTTLYTHSNTSNTDAWYQNTVNLTPYASSIIYLRFRGVSNYGSGSCDLAVDNVLIEDIPTGPPLAPELTSPLQLTNMPIEGFNMTWTPDPNSGPTDYYKVYLWTDAQSQGQGPVLITTGTYLDPTDPPEYPVGTPQTPVVFNYLDHYNWTVEAYSGNYPNQGAYPTASWFTIEADPTVYVPPTYTMDFETWPPLGWDLSGGTQSFLQYTDANSNNWARANYYSQSSGNTNIMTTPPIVAAQDLQLLFTWSHYYSSSYPNDALAVYVSEDMVNWGTAIWNKTGTDLDSADGASYSGPGTGVTEIVNIPLSQETTFYIRFVGTSGYGYDLYIDNVIVRVTPTALEAPILTYPADGATDLPKAGFNLTWENNPQGMVPDYFKVFLWTDEQGEYGGPYWETADATVTSLNPTVVIPEGATEPLSFAYDERWNWTVAAVAGSVEEVAVSRWFTIQSDPTITLPHTQDFGTDSTPVWPNGWTQTYSGGVTSDRWNVSASTSAGGTANEMKCSWYDATGISRLITPPINTNGIPLFTASFNQYYNDFGAGVTAKLQYSHDLNTWYDTDYAIISGSGSIGSYETVTISGLNAPVTYLAWVMDGNHYQFNYWYVDDVYLAVPYNLDAKAVSIEMYQVVEPVAFTPMATVGNNGLQTISFSVTMTIGGTTLPVQSVTALAPGATQQLSFGSFTPVANTFYDVTVTTNLAGDENPANDTIAGQFVCIELNKTAYGDACYDPGNILDGPATFSLRDPGTITDLPAANPWPDHFLAGADWINGGWWGVEYYDEDNLTGGNWWQIDTTTGAGTDNGDVGLYLSGVAWDPVADVVYGVNANSLYTLDKLTGAPTLIGQLTWGGSAFNGRLVDIAWNNNNSTLYGLDLGYDAVFTIDPVTLAVTPLGYTVGYDLEYAQGMAFDQDTGFLYLAASTDNDGFLLWVNTNQPDAEGYMGETYYIGRLQRGCEVDGFVIPYPQLAIPDLTIALESGVPTLSWNSIVGASAYKVYGSNDPYAADPWTLVATTASTTYAYVGTEPYHFFKVTAVDSPAPVRTQFTGLERVRQVFQPTRVQYNRDIQPQATGTRASRTKPVK